MTSDNLPPGSCDCHVHIFGDARCYPPQAGAAYLPPAATLEDLHRLHAELGIARAVLVQPTIYGTDHRLLIEALRNRPQFRGVAMINDNVTDDDLAVLHGAGIRAARFSLGGPLGAMPRVELDRSVARTRELGWHAKFGGSARDLIANGDWLRKYDAVGVLDHLAGANLTDGSGEELVNLVMELLRNGNWWILLANADRRSQASQGWDDMLTFVRAFISAAPKRAIWATDWPHVLYPKPELPDDRILVAYLQRAAPDRTTLEDILVHNPAHLYGFEKQHNATMDEL